jgi:hypothetical protein
VKRVAPLVAACAMLAGNALLAAPRVTAQTPSPSSTPTVAPTAAPALRCTIVGLSTNFPSAGSMSISLDASVVGTFQFEPTGTQTLSFDCAPGDHRFSVSASLAVGGTYDCDGTVTIAIDKIDFFLRMATTGNTATCRLTPV